MSKGKISLHLHLQVILILVANVQISCISTWNLMYAMVYIRPYITHLVGVRCQSISLKSKQRALNCSKMDSYQAPR